MSNKKHRKSITLKLLRIIRAGLRLSLKGHTMVIKYITKQLKPKKKKQKKKNRPTINNSKTTQDLRNEKLRALKLLEMKLIAEISNRNKDVSFVEQISPGLKSGTGLKIAKKIVKIKNEKPQRSKLRSPSLKRS